MKKEVKTLYKCDHCGKRYLREACAKVHEVRCHLNPDNKRACFDCVYLSCKYEYSEDDGEETKTRGFFCSKKDCFVYPPKVEYKDNKKVFLDYDNIPMLKECDEWKSTCSVVVQPC